MAWSVVASTAQKFVGGVGEAHCHHLPAGTDVSIAADDLSLSANRGHEQVEMPQAA